MYLQADAAYSCVSQLGELGIVQFKDVSFMYRSPSQSVYTFQIFEIFFDYSIFRRICIFFASFDAF